MEFTFFFIEIKEMAGNQRATSVSEAIREGHRLERNVLGGRGTSSRTGGILSQECKSSEIQSAAQRWEDSCAKALGQCRS